jgi:ferredoxin-type protein NapH
VETVTGVKKQTNLKHLLRTTLISLPMWLITLLLLTRLDFSDPVNTISGLTVYFFVNILFVRMIHTGKIDRYRSILFIASAIFFPISFISTLYQERGTFMVLSNEETLRCMVPFCHIVIPQTLLPAILKRDVIFPGAFTGFNYSIPVMIVIWLAASVSLGRGFCSWMCFYGGWEDGFSRLRKKPVLKIFSKKLLLLPFAVLLVVAILSAATLSAQYCWWVCPFKSVSEFPEVSSLLRLVQTVIFIILFIGLVIVLPILTKKRTQCSFLCPFGAMQSFTNKISPFELRIDRQKCTDCKLCINNCPVYALDEESLKNGRTKMTCLKCGKCADLCRNNAIDYHIKGTKLKIGAGFAKIIFSYIAFILLAAMGGGFIIDSISKILIMIIK